jgi:hypothetical protein
LVPGGRGFRATLIGCAIAVGAGAVLVATGHALPVYDVPFAHASAAYVDWCTPTGVDHAAGQRYRAMFGWHYALMNAGVLLASIGLTTAVIALALRSNTNAGLCWLRSPGDRSSFIVIGIGVMLLTLAGLIVGLQTDLERRHFPACADSIGIPIAGLSALTFILVPILSVLGLLVALGFGGLPAPLHQWDSNRPIRSWTITMVFGLAMAGGVAMLLLGAFSADLVGPSAVVTLYLLASTRAALLAPKWAKGEN